MSASLRASFPHKSSAPQGTRDTEEKKRRKKKKRKILLKKYEKKENNSRGCRDCAQGLPGRQSGPGPSCQLFEKLERRDRWEKWCSKVSCVAARDPRARKSLGKKNHARAAERCGGQMRQPHRASCEKGVSRRWARIWSFLQKGKHDGGQPAPRAPRACGASELSQVAQNKIRFLLNQF